MSAWTEGSQRDATLAALPVELKVAGGQSRSWLQRLHCRMSLGRAVARWRASSRFTPSGWLCDGSTATHGVMVPLPSHNSNWTLRSVCLSLGRISGYREIERKARGCAQANQNGWFGAPSSLCCFVGDCGKRIPRWRASVSHKIKSTATK